MKLKDRVRSTSAIDPVAVFLRRVWFPGATKYWQRRYAKGGNSGVGSYGRVAEYKAAFLNEFVVRHQIASVIEFGCGDGAQLRLAQYPRYVGFDVAPGAIDLCRDSFPTDGTKSFLLYDPRHFENRGAIVGDLAISLDVILHLVEDEDLELYLKHLFNAARRYVVIFTEDEARNEAPHVRYRKVDDWAGQQPGWQLLDRVQGLPKGLESRADFFVFGRAD
ncbi:MAG TPA: class I SAM-dependent methyltransferase [Frankiaceae bacterium]|nr:class I SAM-dependent methyltransferase [Frankiaceae bacterium]